MSLSEAYGGIESRKRKTKLALLLVQLVVLSSEKWLSGTSHMVMNILKDQWPRNPHKGSINIPCLPPGVTAVPCQKFDIM